MIKSRARILSRNLSARPAIYQTACGIFYCSSPPQVGALIHSRTITTNTVTARFPSPPTRRTCGLFPSSSSSSFSGSRARHIPERPHSFGFHSDALALPDSPSQRDTIYALATPPGRAGIAVIRISGPRTVDVWRQMLVFPPRRGVNSNINATLREAKGVMEVEENRHAIRPRHLVRCKIVDEQREPLDDGMAVFFNAPNTYTSHDVLELHLHSGRAIISSVLACLSRMRGFRLAEPGEFTRWAYEAGRIDLTEVEGIRDLVDAETEGQRKLALRSAAGETKRRFDALRNDIIKCLSTIEALIDFGEGEDIEEGVYDLARRNVHVLRDAIVTHLSDNRRGEIIRSGIRLAIFGPPNAGKSSLLNYLAQREAAIVTSLPGTTRDVLEISLDVGGLPVIACDTAGLRETDDVVEAIGVQRANDAVESADVALCLLPLPDVLAPNASLPADVIPHLTDKTLVLFTKSDLVPDANLLVAKQALLPYGPTTIWSGSIVQENGMDEFMSGFVATLKERFYGGSDNKIEPLVTHARHRMHLEAAVSFLDAFLLTDADTVVFGAEELRYAAQEIGKISGAVDVEDVLDRIFRDFCIGK